MPFSDVLHQQAAQDRLQRALQAGRVPHAFLFAGPEGVGKEMLAARLAAVLLCSDPRPVPAPSKEGGMLPKWLDACGRCEDCVLQGAGNHPDYHRIYRALNKLHPDANIRKRKAVELSVDVIRHFLLDKIGLHPGRGRAKIFIVAEAHLLSDSAQNAMLKTLEEPPDHSYLILLTDSIELLLPTTRSRCQHVAFRRLPSAFVVQHLVTRLGAPPAAAQFLAELSQGSMGVATRGLQAGLFNHLPGVIGALQSAPADALGCGKRLQDLAAGLIPALSGRAAEDAAAAEQDDEPAADTLEDDEDETKSGEEKDGGDGAATNVIRDARKTVLAMAAVVLRDVQRMLTGTAAASLPGHPALGALVRLTDPEMIRQGIRALAGAEYQIDRSANVSLIFDTVGIAMGRALGARG